MLTLHWKINVNDCAEEDYLHVDLAPCYGTLSKASLDEMDDNLKVMITVTMRSLHRLRGKEKRLSWENVQSTLLHNQSLELVPSSDIYRKDRFTRNDAHFRLFKFNASPDSAIIHEVSSLLQVGAPTS